MKKIITTITITAILVVAFASLAYAADKKEIPQWFNDMITWKKDQVNQAVKDGKLTEEQGKTWNERYDDMEKWYNENGFDSGVGPGYGGCHGGFDNQSGFSGGYGSGMMRGGYGPGMMRGYSL